MTLPGPPRKPNRLVYLGTPEVAVEPLVALHEAGFDIPLVVSRPDKRRGRGGKVTPSPVKAAAMALGLPVTDDITNVLDVEAQVGVVVAYGRLIATPILEELPMVNLHFSLLPRWRGAAPVERAILCGDESTGVCLMAVAEELDVGDVFARREVAIDENETLDELRSRLVTIGAEMVVSEFRNGLADPVAQTGEAVYAAKLEAADHRLDFTRSAVELHRVIRLGRAWCEFRGKRLKVLSASTDAGYPDGCPDRGENGAGEVGSIEGPLVMTGSGLLRLGTVQPEGKKPVDARSWLNGAQPGPDDRLV